MTEPAPPQQPSLLSKLGAYRKTVTAFAGAGLTVAVAEYGSSNHWVSIALAAATVLGVYVAPNTPKQ